MPVPLIHEDDCDLSIAEEFSMTDVSEDCFFCARPTRFWHALSNSPVCPSCAKTASEADLPVALSDSHPAYQPTRSMTSRDMILREREEDLERHERALIGSSASPEEIGIIRRKRINAQRAMRRAGLPVKRSIEPIRKTKKQSRHR